jgi:uncharacterized protein YciI
MLFAFVLHDAPGMAARRIEVRPEHKAYLAGVAERIAFAGPLLDETGEMSGSLLVIDFSDRAAALGWLAAEPFTRAGVYGRSEVSAFRNLWPQKAGFAET